MKYIFGAMLLMVCVFAANAQHVVTTGKPYAVIDAQSKFYFSKNSQVMAVKNSRKEGLSIQKFRQDLSFEKIKLYNDFEKGYVIESVTEFDGKYYVFYSSWNGSQEQLFAREIDFDKGEFTGKGKKIVTVNEKVSGDMATTGFYSMAVVNKFDFFFSHDSSKLLVQYRVRPAVKTDSKNFAVIGLTVFDRDLNVAWTQEVKMPYNERKMKNLDYVVDRKNNAYIVAKVYADDTNEKVDEDGNPNYAIEILKVAPGAKEVERFPVNLADKFVQTVWIYESPKGQLVCAGFYNKGKKADNADGIITFRLSDDGKVLDVSSYEIPLEILNQYASARTQRKNEKKDEKENAEFKNLKLKEIHFAKDGGMLLISEQYYYNEYNLQSQHGIMTRVSYSYDDILVAKLSANGKLDWMKKIPKRQVGGAGQGGMSYKYARSGNDHYFLFLDNERNRDLALDEVPATHHDGQGGYLIAYKLDDKTGDGKKVSLLNTRNVNGTEVFYYMPSRTVRTGPGEFVFEVYKKKKEDILIWVKI